MAQELFEFKQFSPGLIVEPHNGEHGVIAE